MYRACGLKHKVIEERRQIAGYSALVFSHPNDQKALKLTDAEVLATYHKLVEIEDCFRAMKSSFSIRPVYVRLRQHIIAHCYLCVLSLMLLKLVQEKLASKNFSLTISQITEALLDATLVPMPSDDGRMDSFMNCGFNSEFFKPKYTGKTRQIQDENLLESSEKIYENFTKDQGLTPNHIDQILLAVGLTPLNFLNSLGEIKTKFGLKSLPNDLIIAKQVSLYQQDLMQNLKISAP